MSNFQGVAQLSKTMISSGGKEELATADVYTSIPGVTINKTANPVPNIFEEVTSNLSSNVLGVDTLSIFDGMEDGNVVVNVANLATKLAGISGAVRRAVTRNDDAGLIDAIAKSIPGVNDLYTMVDGVVVDLSGNPTNVRNLMDMIKVITGQKEVALNFDLSDRSAQIAVLTGILDEISGTEISRMADLVLREANNWADEFSIRESAKNSLNNALSFGDIFSLLRYAEVLGEGAIGRLAPNSIETIANGYRIPRNYKGDYKDLFKDLIKLFNKIDPAWRKTIRKVDGGNKEVMASPRLYNATTDFILVITAHAFSTLDKDDLTKNLDDRLLLTMFAETGIVSQYQALDFPYVQIVAS